MGSDAISFRMLNADALLARDNQTVYQNGEIVSGIDVKTFESTGSTMLCRKHPQSMR